MRTNDMRVPQVEQLGRTITALGGPATIVAIISPDAKRAEVACQQSWLDRKMQLYECIGPTNLTSVPRLIAALPELLRQEVTAEEKLAGSFNSPGEDHSAAGSFVVERPQSVFMIL